MDLWFLEVHWVLIPFADGILHWGISDPEQQKIIGQGKGEEEEDAHSRWLKNPKHTRLIKSYSTQKIMMITSLFIIC